MKKFILIIITTAFFIYPSICLSSYLIELKNGSTFITNHYWKEGRQIKFYCYGGVVGIGKDLIRKISESDLPYKEAVEQEAPETSDQTPEIGSREAWEKAGKEIETKKKEIDVEYYKKEKGALVEKKEEVNNKLKQAIEAGNKVAKRNLKKELSLIKKQITELTLKLKKENKGRIPGWWDSQ